MSGPIITIMNNKGGSAKTTTAYNLAHAIANQKKSVCTIDMDAQCNLSKLYKLTAPKYSLYEVFDDHDIPVSSCIYPTDYEKVMCLPNVEETGTLEYPLTKTCKEAGKDEYQVLRDRIRDYCRTNFDYTLLDCPPNIGFFSLNAMVAADFVIVPIVAGSSHSFDGLIKAVKLIKEVRQNHNPDLKFLKLLICNIDKRTIMGRVSLEQVSKTFDKEHVFDTIITSSTLFEQSEHLGITIIRHATNSAGANCFRDLAKEVIELTTTFGL